MQRLGERMFDDSNTKVLITQTLQHALATRTAYQRNSLRYTTMRTSYVFQQQEYQAPHPPAQLANPLPTLPRPRPLSRATYSYVPLGELPTYRW
jgi:hypothetical protein